MQFNSNAQSAQLHPVALALYKLEYWAEQLQIIRSERRQIIADTTISEEWRKHSLRKNADDTTVIRARISECQFDHVAAVEASANRIAHACNAITPPVATLSANDDLYRTNTDGGVE